MSASQAVEHSSSNDQPVLASQQVSTDPSGISVIRLQEETTPVVCAVILKYNDTYVTSRDFILRLIALVSAVVYLIFATTGSHTGCDYLCLPFAGQLRFVVFVCVLCLLIGLVTTLLRLSMLINMFPLDWNLFDVMVYGTLASLLFVSSVLVAAAVSSSSSAAQFIVSSSTVRHYVTAVVVGLSSMLLHGAVCAVTLRDRRLHHITDPRRQHAILLSQTSSSSVTTTTEIVPGNAS